MPQTFLARMQPKQIMKLWHAFRLPVVYKGDLRSATCVLRQLVDSGFGFIYWGSAVDFADAHQTNEAVL